MCKVLGVVGIKLSLSGVAEFSEVCGLCIALTL